MNNKNTLNITTYMDLNQDRTFKVIINKSYIPSKNFNKGIDYKRVSDVLKYYR